jgi:CubicO group peptidase (beta-lactamase class C family)
VRLRAADDLLLARLGDYFEALRTHAGIPGLAAAIVGPNDVLWEGSFGHQDVARAIPALPTTPFHLDGITQLFTATMVLRCVEEGKLSLDDRLAKFDEDHPEAGATIRQLLTHTSGPADDLTFAYRPERLLPLIRIVRICATGSYRKTLGNLLEQLAMVDSVPGPDVNSLTPPAEGVPTPQAAERYARVLERLAQPYAVTPPGRPTLTTYSATTLTPAAGLISTVRDFAQFDLGLKQGVLLRADTLAVAWRPPVNRLGQALPHGIGWFVEQYHGEQIVWQFGSSENGSSSLVISAPARGLTMIALANSNGLSKPLVAHMGELTASPFARVFLGLFVR